MCKQYGVAWKKSLQLGTDLGSKREGKINLEEADTSQQVCK